MTPEEFAVWWLRDGELTAKDLALKLREKFTFIYPGYAWTGCMPPLYAFPKNEVKNG